MEYRINRKTGDKISVIGIGTSHISEAGFDEAVAILKKAFENGVNYFDLAAADADCFPPFGEAFKDVRDKVFYQVHFGANYSGGKYGWTTSLETVKKSIKWQLETLKTDYIDYGFIHCIDESSDLDKYIKNGVLDYLKEMKAKGIVRHIGISTHTPALANRALDLGCVDMLMFSINAAYDYQHGAYARGSSDERMALYKRCEAEGVGISVMKSFGSGQLLDAKASPFKQALTPYQCINYALSKPGVLTVMCGVGKMSDLDGILGYCDARPEEKDFGILGSLVPENAIGKCVYCKHCHPCPAGLDIGLINKYYDLAQMGDSLAADHYKNLEKKAEDCIKCGHCNSRCPFHVDQMARMSEIAEYFKNL